MRRLFTAIAFLSLLALIATIILWLRSYHRADQIDWVHARGWRSVRSDSGHILIDLLIADWSNQAFQFHRPTYKTEPAMGDFNYFLLLGGSKGDIDRDWHHAGFAWHQKHNPGRDTNLIRA